MHFWPVHHPALAMPTLSEIVTGADTERSTDTTVGSRHVIAEVGGKKLYKLPWRTVTHHDLQEVVLVPLPPRQRLSRRKAPWILRIERNRRKAEARAAFT